MKTLSALILIYFGVFALGSVQGEPDKNNTSFASSELSKLNSQEGLLLLLQVLVQEEYSRDRAKSISDVVRWLQENSETGNVTLVGSQNIYNEDGSLKEIRTIELSIPKQQAKSVVDLNPYENDDDNNDFDTDDFEKLTEIRQIINLLSAVGVDVKLAYTETNKAGELQEVLYLAKDFLIAKSEGIFFMNKTISLNNINEIPPVKPGIVLTSSLSYDEQGKFLKNISFVQPELFGVIESDYDKPDPKMIKTTLRLLVNVVLETENRDDVPENLRQRLESVYPDIKFVVTTDEPDGSYFYKDFSVHLTYDYVELSYGPKYSVYGHYCNSD